MSRPAYPLNDRSEIADTEFALAVKDVSIIAVVVVIAIILIVIFSVFLIVRFLRSVVDDVGKQAPSAECTAWLEMRRRGYLSAASLTRTFVDNCEAANQAVLDSQSSAPGSGGLCPIVPPPAAQQYPYLAYMPPGCAAQ